MMETTMHAASDLGVVELAALREEFPVTRRLLYLDSAHQSPLSRTVRAALDAFHDEGMEMGGPKATWLARAEETRARVARLLNASPHEIAFTKNTSEGLNIAATTVPLAPGDNVLMIEGDHPNNAYAWLNQARRGVEVRMVPFSGEAATAATFAPYVDQRTRVITLSHVTFHAGHRHDLADIGRFCSARGIHLVADAMQSVGVLPVDVKAMGISMLAAGCHKGLLVPQGLGFVYVKDGLELLPPPYLAHAGLVRPPADLVARPGDLEVRRDAGRFELGNLNLPGVHALGAALDLIFRVGVRNIEAHVLALGDRLIEHLDALGIRLVGPRGRQHRAHIYVMALPVAEWLDYLAANRVRVSPERDGIRVSFGLFNTLEDVERLAGILRARRAS
jgi:cysteine desulfurase / selenocysteine lyase